MLQAVMGAAPSAHATPIPAPDEGRDGARGPVGSPELASAVRQSHPPPCPTLAAGGRRAHADGGDETGSARG